MTIPERKKLRNHQLRDQDTDDILDPEYYLQDVEAQLVHHSIERDRARLRAKLWREYIV